MPQAGPRPPLFWDFHGTLTLPDHNWFDAAMEAAAEYAPEFRLEREILVQNLTQTCLPWFTHPEKDTRHLSGSQRWWAHCAQEFERMFRRCGMPAPQAALAAPGLRRYILQPHRYRLYPDAASTLQALQNRGYTHYILSNNFPELADIVSALGLAPLFRGIVTSGLAGYEKPRAELFCYALAQAGYTGGPPPVMVGDNPVDDIQGARAAGFTTIAVHNTAAPEAAHRVDALSDILPLLA